MEVMKPILIVCAERCYAQSVARHLKREGFAPATAANLGEAEATLEQARQGGNGFGLIVMGLAELGDDGREHLRWLHRTYPDLPAVIIYGFGDEAGVRQTTSHRQYEYCQQPVTPEALLEALKRLDGKGRQPVMWSCPDCSRKLCGHRR